MVSTQWIYQSGIGQLQTIVLVFLTSLFFGGFAVAQGSPLEPPPPFKPVVSIRGGGVEHNAPYRVPQRVVQGTVRDANNIGIPRAEVFLKDEKTSQIRQMLADDKGKYLFGGLSLADDYHVWAKVGEASTPKRPVGSFIGMHDVTVDFHLPDANGSSETSREIQAAR